MITAAEALILLFKFVYLKTSAEYYYSDKSFSRQS